jgi:hypothetical protein
MTHREWVTAGLLALALGQFGPVAQAAEAAAAAAAAADAVADHLSERWYVTEVVVFQRPGVMDFQVEEDLARHGGVRLPRDLQTFRSRPFGAGIAIDPFTRLCLTYPVLQVAESAAPGADGLPDTPPGSIEAADAAAPDTGEPGAHAPDAGERAGATPPPAIEPQLGADPLLDFLRAVAEFEQRLRAASYRWLDPSTFTLAAEAERLARRYPVLLHGRWLQPVPERDAPEPLLVQAGPRYGDVHALEGTFHVTLGRFLHFRADLLYREPLLGAAPVSRALPPAQADAARDAGPLAVPAISPPQRAGFMQLRESRRLRSGELHYLDHPKLGILVRIDPVSVPAELSAAWAALEEGEQ